jgi:hypothetical protein
MSKVANGTGAVSKSEVVKLVWIQGVEGRYPCHRDCLSMLSTAAKRY